MAPDEAESSDPVDGGPVGDGAGDESPPGGAGEESQPGGAGKESPPGGGGEESQPGGPDKESLREYADEESLRDYGERIAAVLNGAGFPRMPARVLMALMVSENGLTAGELGDRLDVSAGAISGAVRYLQTLAMVHRVAQPRSRQGVYEVHRAWYSASLAQNRVYDAIISMSDQILGVAGGRDSAVGERLDEMVSFYRFLRVRLPELLTEWQELRKTEGRA